MEASSLSSVLPQLNGNAAAPDVPLPDHFDVWVLNKHGVYEVGTAEKTGEDVFQVTCRSTERFMLSASQANELRVNPSQQDGIEDSAKLDHTSEPAALHNLETRYKKGLSYTFAGRSLVTIRPGSQVFNYYDAEVKEFTGHRGPAVPHPLTFAEQAISTYLTSSEDQSIIVSGTYGSTHMSVFEESVRYLAFAPSVDGNRKAPELAEKLMKAIFVLNALSTTYFDKDQTTTIARCVKLYIDENTESLYAASIKSYLFNLVPASAERANTFTVFHYLFAGLTDELRTKNSIQATGNYKLLQNLPPLQSNDAKWKTFLESLEPFTSATERADLVDMLCGIIHLAQLSFSSDKNGKACQIDDLTTLTSAANMLKVVPNRLRSALAALSPEAANAHRNTLSRTIYGTLVSWLMDKVNTVLLGQNNPNNRFIVLTDFAIWNTSTSNSIGELLYNALTETIGSFSHRHAAGTSLTSSAKVGRSLESPLLYMSILSALDEANKDHDAPTPVAAFMSKLRTLEKQHKTLHTYSPDRFRISETTGDVDYDVVDLIDKNKSNLRPDMRECFRYSGHTLIADLFRPPSGASPKHRGGGALGHSHSLSHKYLPQISHLLEELSKTDARFIYCLSPNQQNDLSFDARHVLLQLRYFGLIDQITRSKKSSRTSYDPTDAKKLLSTELSFAQAKLDFERTRANAIKRSNDSLQGDVQSLEKQNALLEKKVVDLEDEIEELEAYLEDSDKSREALFEKLKMMERDFGDEIIKMAQLAESHVKDVGAVGDLSRRLNTALEQIASLRKSNEDLKAKLTADPVTSTAATSSPPTPHHKMSVLKQTSSLLFGSKRNKKRAKQRAQGATSSIPSSSTTVGGEHANGSSTLPTKDSQASVLHHSSSSSSTLTRHVDDASALPPPPSRQERSSISLNLPFFTKVPASSTLNPAATLPLMRIEDSGPGLDVTLSLSPFKLHSLILQLLEIDVAAFKKQIDAALDSCGASKSRSTVELLLSTLYGAPLSNIKTPLACAQLSYLFKHLGKEDWAMCAQLRLLDLISSFDVSALVQLAVDIYQAMGEDICISLIASKLRTQRSAFATALHNMESVLKPHGALSYHLFVLCAGDHPIHVPDPKYAHTEPSSTLFANIRKVGGQIQLRNMNSRDSSKRTTISPNFVITFQCNNKSLEIHDSVLYLSWAYFRRLYDSRAEEEGTSLTLPLPPSVVLSIVRSVYRVPLDVKLLSEEDCLYLLDHCVDLELMDTADDSAALRPLPLFEPLLHYASSVVFPPLTTKNALASLSRVAKFSSVDAVQTAVNFVVNNRREFVWDDTAMDHVFSLPPSISRTLVKTILAK